MGKTRTFISNFAGSTQKSDLAKLANAVTKNMFVESVSSDHAVQTILRGMPGWKKIFDTVGTPRAIYKSTNDRMFWVSGYDVYCDGHVVGHVALSDVCSICETSGTNPHIVVCDGFNLLAINTSDTISQMTENPRIIELPQYNGVVIRPLGVEFMGGYLYCLANNDKFYVSCLQPFEEDNSTYQSTRDDIFMLNWRNVDTGELIRGKTGYYVNTNFKSDKAKVITTYRGKIFVGGEKSIEIFSYLGGDTLYQTDLNGGSNIFQRQDNECLTSGCEAVIDAKGDVCWISEGSLFVNGTKVSNDDVDRRLHNETFKELSWLEWYSHKLILCYTENSTIAYDMSNGTWIDIVSSFDGIDSRFRYSKCFDKYAMCDSAIVEWTEDKWNEHDNNSIVKSRHSPVIARNGDRVHIEKLAFRTNAGQFQGNGWVKVWIDGDIEIADCQSLSTFGRYSEDIEEYYIGDGKQFEVELATDANGQVAFYGLDVDALSCYN